MDGLVWMFGRVVRDTRLLWIRSVVLGLLYSHTLGDSLSAEQAHSLILSFTVSHQMGICRFVFPTQITRMQVYKKTVPIQTPKYMLITQLKYP